MKGTIRSGSGEKFFGFDTGACLLEFSGCGFEKKIPLGAFLRFSSSTPWDFPAAEYENVRLAIAPGDENMLVIAAENREFLAGLSFNFDGELLKGDLLVSFKQDSGKNFAALALPVPGDSIFTCPGVLYNNNPAVAEVQTIAHFAPTGPASLMVEESRLPITGVNAEKDGVFLSFFSVPETEEKEWTLGLHRESPEETLLMLGSGCLSFNGVKDRIYIAKRAIADSGCVYRNFKAGDRLTKRFALSWGKTPHKGHGFRDLVKNGFELLSPVAEPARSREEVIELKMQALRERWAGDGYLDVLPDNFYRAPLNFLFGWVGQSFRLALCDMRYSLLKGTTEGIDRMRRCVDFFLQTSRTAVPGLRNNYFRIDEMQWRANGSAEEPLFSSRALGETWSDLARIIRCCREHDLPEPEGALAALEEGLQFFLDHRLPCGVVPCMWKKDGTPGSEEISCAGSGVLPAFFEFYRLTGEERWRKHAEEMLDFFYRTGGNDFATPFSRATLDAACEDKEACIPFFTAAALAYEITGEAKFRDYAEAAADWLLTWVYFHEVPFEPDSICARNNFRATGWPSVSVEHHHLDVFFPPWELYKFGKAVGNSLYKSMGKTVFAAWSHGISSGGGDWLFQAPGRQAEQFFQTRWYFRPPDGGSWESYHPLLRYQLHRNGYTKENLCERHHRGGCNPWDVAWIIALVLDAALGFEEEQRDTRPR